MIKILMTGASNIGKAGVATIAFNLGQHMDSAKVNINYLAQHGLSDEKYRRMIENKGGKIYVMDSISENKVIKMIKTVEWIGAIAKKEPFDAVHINSDTAYLAAAYTWIFKRAGISKIIIHSHSTMVDDNNKVRRIIKIFIHKICKIYVKKNAQVKLACSEHAAKWMFDKEQVTIIPNGIDVDRFKFNQKKRNEYRKNMNLENRFVICSVGRLAYQKNTFFTMDIFKEILHMDGNSVLLFVGDGELRLSAEKYAEVNGLNEKIFFLGNREDISEILSVSDVFLLPSRFEGLGIVYIEAQVAGMPVFASDHVPSEAFITDTIFKVSLNDSPQHWAKTIFEHKNDERKDQSMKVKSQNYDIHTAALLLQNKYIDFIGLDKKEVINNGH